ncbi:MAG: hypothetical protein ABIF10_06955, partial [Candidatus Woesearchaeota archaeon]
LTRIINDMQKNDPVNGNHEIKNFAEALKETAEGHQYLKRKRKIHAGVQKQYSTFIKALDSLKEKAEGPNIDSVLEKAVSAPKVYGSKEEQLPLGFTRGSNIVPKDQGTENAKYAGYKQESYTHQHKRSTFGRRLGKTVAAAIAGLYFTLAPMPSLDSMFKNSQKSEQTADYNQNALAANETPGNKRVLSTDRDPFEPQYPAKGNSKPESSTSVKAARKCVQPPYKPSPRVPVMPLKGVIKETGKEYTLKGGNALNEISGTGGTIIIRMGNYQKIPAPRIVDGEIYESRFGIQYNSKNLRQTVEIKLEPGKEYSFNAGLMADATLSDVVNSCCKNLISNVYESDKFRIKLKIPGKEITEEKITEEKITEEKEITIPKKVLVPRVGCYEKAPEGVSKTYKLASLPAKNLDFFRQGKDGGRPDSWKNYEPKGDVFAKSLTDEINNPRWSLDNKSVRPQDNLEAKVYRDSELLKLAESDVQAKYDKEIPWGMTGQKLVSVEPVKGTAWQKLTYTGNGEGNSVTVIEAPKWHTWQGIALEDPTNGNYRIIGYKDYSIFDKSKAAAWEIGEIEFARLVGSGKLQKFLDNQIDWKYGHALINVIGSTPDSLSRVYMLRKGAQVPESIRNNCEWKKIVLIYGAVGPGANGDAVTGQTAPTNTQTAPVNAPTAPGCGPGNR